MVLELQRLRRLMIGNTRGALWTAELRLVSKRSKSGATRHARSKPAEGKEISKNYRARKIVTRHGRSRWKWMIALPIAPLLDSPGGGTLTLWGVGTGNG